MIEMNIDEIKTTRDIRIPKAPIDRIIGQNRAIEKVKIAGVQRRHLLLVGPPGIGKSMLAQALALHLPKPNEEICVLHNPQNPERPILEVMRGDTERVNSPNSAVNDVVEANAVPSFVAEQLGFRCQRCGGISSFKESICPKCGDSKYGRVSWNRQRSPFSDIITEVFEVGSGGPEREVHTTRVDKEGEEEIVIYQRFGDEKIRILSKGALDDMKKNNERKQKKVLVPMNRIPFVHATGASETELLGDVRHDPYGGHPEIGTPTYLRVIPGAIHEAHEGVLFVDELPHMQYLQNFILTAMQEKKFSIVGRNPYSAGASVKVNDVPCDFIFVGACNIKDVGSILPALRSRINGNGYEILLETTMPDTEENRDRVCTSGNCGLDFYRPGAASPQSVDISDLLNHILGLMSQQLTQRGIRVVTDLPSNLPTVMAASSQIQQVFINLILNASDAMMEGGDLHIRARRSRGGIEIFFQDSGPGVPMEFRPKIFEPFISTKEGGTGLGLTVSYNIVTAHGGILDLVAGNEMGACFRVFLPTGGKGQ